VHGDALDDARNSRQTELGTPKRIAFVLPFRLVRRSGYNSPRSASRPLFSLVPFRDERLVRSRMVFITDAPTVGVGLRGVAQAIAQGSTLQDTTLPTGGLSLRSILLGGLGGGSSNYLIAPTSTGIPSIGHSAAPMVVRVIASALR
jgi:hypothetical protein